MITENIYNLLHEYECVVVPGFGGFVTNYRASEMDTSGKVMRPPTRDLDFVDKLTFNDGVLVRRLAEKNGRSYQEAIHSIEDYTKNCTDKLYKQQTIYVPKVGEIRADVKGNTQFRAENTNFLADAFGLPELKLTPISTVTTTQVPVKTVITPAPVVTSQTKNMAKSSFNLFNILLLATIAFAAYFAWDVYFNTKRTTETRTEKKLPVYDDDEDLYDEDLTELDETNDIDYTNNTTVISSDEYIDNEPIEEVKTTQEPEQVVREERVVKPTKTPTTNTSPTRSYGTKKYVIIVGSFADGGNANRMINECRRQGYETTTSWSGSMKRVGVVVNCTKNQLDGKLRQVQSRFNSGAWVMK